MSTKKNPFNVEKGQFWREVDPRVKNRCIKVIRIEDGKAHVETSAGRRTKASLTRFHGKRGGYALVTP